MINLTRTFEAGNATRSLRWLTTDLEELQREWPVVRVRRTRHLQALAVRMPVDSSVSGGFLVSTSDRARRVR